MSEANDQGQQEQPVPGNDLRQPHRIAPAQTDGASIEGVSPLEGETLVESTVPPADITLAESLHSAPPQAPPEARERSTLTPWQPGDIIADIYEVRELLGYGAMGTVHRVHHREWGMDLAVKTPTENALQAAGGRERFQEREAYEWVQLGLHPNIASCSYVRTLDDGIPRIFIEYVDGGSLADWLAQGKVTDLATALDMWVQICWGLGWAHKRGLVHRDVKPANILMTADGTPKVTDFGLVKPVKETDVVLDTTDQALPGRTTLSGTPGYSAPEQWQPGRPITAAADVYALGIVSYELLRGPLGLPTFLDADPRGRPALYRRYLERRNQALAQILLRCMAARPQARYSDANSLADEVIHTYSAVRGRAYPHSLPDRIQIQADGLNNRAISLIDLGRTAEAERLLDMAQELEPNHPQVIYNQGLLLWRSRRISDQELVHRLEVARTWRPEVWRYRYLIGLIHTERGDRAAAVTALEEAAEASEGDSQVAQALQRAKEMAHPHKVPYMPVPPSGFREAALFRSHLDQAKQALSAGLIGQAEAGIQRARQIPGYQQSRDALDLRFEMGQKGIRKGLRSIRLVAILEGQTSTVTSVCIAPNGRLGVSGSEDSLLTLWNLETGLRLRAFDSHAGPINSIDISSDGRLALTGNTDRTLWLWDLTTNKSLRTFQGHTDWITSVAISSDGRLGLSASTDKTLRLWDLATGRRLRTFEEHTGWVLSGAISPDGRFGLSASADKTVRLWDLVTGRCVQVLEGHTKAVTSVAISPDGRWGLSGSADRTLRWWDLATGKCQRVLEEHTAGVTSVAICSDGRFGLSGSEDETLRLWDLTTGQCLRTLRGYTAAVTAISVSPDGRFGLSGSDDRVLRLWEFEWAYEFPAQADWDEGARPYLEAFLMRHIPYGPDGVSRVGPPKWTKEDSRQLLTELGYRGYGWLRPQGIHRELERLASGYAARFTALLERAKSALAEGQIARASTAMEEAAGIPGYAQSPALLDVRFAIGQKGIRSSLQSVWLASTITAHDWSITAVSVSPDGRFALTTGMDAVLRLWDLSTRQCLKTFGGYDARDITAVAISPDGRLGLSGSWDKAVRLWDLSTGRCLRTLEGHASKVASVSISPDSRYGLSGSWDTTLRLWDLSTGRCLETLRGHTGNVNAIAISPDGRFGLSGSADQTLRLWDLYAGKSLSTLRGHRDSINAVAFAPDGRFGLSGGADKTLRLWDLATGQLQRTFEGHSAPLSAVTFAPDGRFGISGCGQKMLRLWDLNTGRCLRTWEERADVVHSVAFLPNGRFGLSASAASSLQMWEFDWAYDLPDPVDWDEDVRPYLNTFLALRVPRRNLLRRFFSSDDAPPWSAEDFQQLLTDLGHRGYGWLRPEGIRRALQEMASKW